MCIYNNHKTTIYKWCRNVARVTTRAPYKQLKDMCIYVSGYDNPKRRVFSFCLNSVMVVDEHTSAGREWKALPADLHIDRLTVCMAPL